MLLRWEVLICNTRFIATFRELGPPDLCHVVKSTGKSGQRDVRRCFVSSILSHPISFSSAPTTTFRAWMRPHQHLLQLISTPSLTQLKTIPLGFPRLRRGRCGMGAIGERTLIMLHLQKIYTQGRSSCFNAFSRVDIRVDVKIPGGVNAYVIDLRGERCVQLFPVWGTEL